MGRNLGERERKSPLKAASNRALAKRPRKRHTRIEGSRRDTKERVQAAIAEIQDFWPYCHKFLCQVITDNVLDSRGKPLMEPVRNYEGKVVGRRRVRVPIALRTSVAQDLFDRTGFSRETTQKITGEAVIPGAMIQLVGFAKPNAAEVSVPAQANGGAGVGSGVNGHAPAPAPAEVAH